MGWWQRKSTTFCSHHLWDPLWLFIFKELLGLTHLVDEVFDGAWEDEVDLVHVPAEAVGHLPHLVRPDEVDRRVDHPAARRR